MLKSKNKVPLRAPRGHYVEIKTDVNRNKDVHVRLVRRSDNRLVGLIFLYRYDRRTYETHSRLDTYLRGRGIGTFLYVRAIRWCLENGYKVQSSGYSSPKAKNVWRGQGIRTFFNVKRRLAHWGENDYEKQHYATWHAYLKY